jgi:CheY-like chemotaxis protein
MTSDQLTQLMSAVTNLLAVLIWPGLILFLILRFRASISDFIGNLGEVNFKAAGVEATARRRQVEAAVALGAAVTKQSQQSTGQVADLSDVAGALNDAVPNARAQRRLEGSHVLWVDDRPDNNRYERQALEALGVRFTLSISTEDALERLRRQKFDLIISDMGRPPDQHAGYTLLDTLRGAGDRTPFVIYAGSRDPEHVKEAREHGALGCTNSAQELILLVTRALGAAAGH